MQAPVIFIHGPPHTGIVVEKPGYGAVQVLFDWTLSVGEVQGYYIDSYPSDIFCSVGRG